MRPHVLQQSTHALLGRQRRGLRPMRGRVLLWERDGASFPREDGRGADGHAQAVRGQIPAGVRTPADGLAGHAPVLGPAVRIPTGAPRRLWQGISELCAEAQGEGRDMEQAGWAGRPPGVRGRASPAGNEVVHVGRGAQRAGPGTGARPPCRSGRRSCEAQAHRPFGLARGADTGAGGPVSVAGVREDARAAAPRKRARAPRVLLAMRAGEEIRPAFVCGEHGWGRVSVLRQWAHGPDVHRLSTGSQAPELEILEPSAGEFWQGSTSSEWGEGFASDVEGYRTRDRRRRLHSGVGCAQLRAALSSTRR